jgi:hypothetical protein
MDYTLFFAIMNLILLARVRLTLRDHGVWDLREYFITGIIPLFILAFLAVNVTTILLAVYLILCPFLTMLLERDTSRLNRNRFTMLIIHLVVIGMLTSPLYNLQTIAWLPAFESSILSVFLPGQLTTAPNWLAVHALIFGLLIILNEVNIMIRLILKELGLAPAGRGKGSINEHQFRTGRVIGFLERIFVFTFVLLQQYAAIGFILAAKGVVRYPDFGNRTFAEYILIGTFLSALLAMVTAFFVSFFL